MELPQGERVGIAFSPGSDNRLSRLILGEPGRSVFRASYGVFYDFGAFAGSSAGALFQATYPPFSVDNRFSSRIPCRLSSNTRITFKPPPVDPAHPPIKLESTKNTGRNSGQSEKEVVVNPAVVEIETA